MGVNSTGTYLLTYLVADAAGNQATATRTVTVTGARSVDLNATVAMDMLWVPAGTFTMGSPTTETGRQSDREDEHNVTLTKGFYLGKYEVTQAQYEAVMTGNTNGLSPTPSQFGGNPNHPVEKVSWDDAQVFLTRLNAQQAANLPSGWSYVLPTESQWEYACRAGTTTAYHGGAIASSNANYNWDGGANDGNDFKQTRDVGQYAANPWGFFDMHGNVWEWTADRYQAAYPTGNPVIDPTGPASGSRRVLRGGSWNNDGTLMRSAARQPHPEQPLHPLASGLVSKSNSKGVTVLAPEEYGECLLGIFLGLWMLKCAHRSFRRGYVFKYVDSQPTETKFYRDKEPFYFWIQVIIGGLAGIGIVLMYSLPINNDW